MTTHKEALKLALEALEDALNKPMWNRQKMEKSISAIKEALAKLDKIAALQQKTESHNVDCLCSDCAALDDLDEALAQPEQEPVAQKIWEEGAYGPEITELRDIPVGAFLYTTPPQRTKPEQEPVGKLQEATAERAWFTIAELNAWADKKLSENPHWVMPKDEPERDEPPPQRTWVGLTDEDCFEALKAVDPEAKRLPLGFSMYAANIQAKLKEKNT